MKTEPLKEGSKIQLPENINYRNERGISLLHHACLQSSELLVNYLLSHGADPNLRDIYDRTPLSYATTAPNINTNIIQLLLTNGANLHKQDSFGRTPLHYCRAESAAQILLDNGADINLKDNDGMTPIIFCAHQKLWPLVYFYCWSGATKDLRDSRSEDIFDVFYAQFRGWGDDPYAKKLLNCCPVQYCLVGEEVINTPSSYSREQDDDDDDQDGIGTIEFKNGIKTTCVVPPPAINAEHSPIDPAFFVPDLISRDYCASPIFLYDFEEMTI